MTLKTGYAATNTDAYIITGSTPVTVTKTLGDDKITWNNSTKKLDIAAGLLAGKYTVILRASNSVGNSTLTFTLTVETPVFWIEVPASFEGGKVSSDPLYIAEEGETVTLTGTPNEGYKLESVSVVHLNNATVVVPVTGSGNLYTFTMPAHHVRVAAVFTSAATAVEDVPNGLKAWTQNGVLYVNGLTEGSQWSVYNVFGVLVYQGVAHDGMAEVALPGRGVFMIVSGNGVVKITN